MNDMKSMIEKWNKLPPVEPYPDEIEAIRQFEEDKANGTLELVDFEEVKARTARANGRVSLRLPRQLHLELIEDADTQNVSLNQYISYILASRPR